MNHDLKVLIDRFEADEDNEHHIESYRPGDHRYYSAWRHNKRLSRSMRSNEMTAWLEGWDMGQTFTTTLGAFKALEDGYNARADATAEQG